MAPAAVCWIEYPAFDRLAILDERDHHAEGEAPGGKIGGAVERVDEPDASFADTVEQARIATDRLFTQNMGIDVERSEAVVQPLLGLAIGDGDDRKRNSLTSRH